MAELPRTATGKMMKTRLREMFSDHELADHQPSRVRHAEEVTGMDPDILVEEPPDELFVGPQNRNAQHCVPAALHVETTD